MGTFTVGCLIKNHVDREKAVRIPNQPMPAIVAVIQGRGGPPPRVPAGRTTKPRRKAAAR